MTALSNISLSISINQLLTRLRKSKSSMNIPEGKQLGSIPAEMWHCRLNLGIGKKIMGPEAVPTLYKHF